MRFGQHIHRLREQDAEWGSHYLNYNDLKDILEIQSEDEEHGDHHDHVKDSGITTQYASQVSEEFSRRLYYETERITLFVFEQQGKIANQLASCRVALVETCEELARNKASNGTLVNETVGEEHFVSIHDGPTSSRNSSAAMVKAPPDNNLAHESLTDSTMKLRQRYYEVGRSILKLYQFVDVNITGIRKIIKKHDKVLNLNLAKQLLRPPPAYPMNRLGSIHGSPSVNDMAKARLAHYGSRIIQPLLNEDFLGALVVSMESGIQSLYQHEFGLDNQSPYISLTENFKSRSFNELSGLNDGPKTMISGSKSSVSLTSAIRNESESIDMVLCQVKAAQRRLRQTSYFVHFLAAPMLVARQDSDEYGEEIETNMEREQSNVSNWLNLLSTFFYMTGYYIVAPTSGDYARLVGGNSGLASLIIGMTSFAALVSTVLYSWWTSYSYKNALVFASVCSTVGNLLYAAGLPCNSLTLVLVGRLLNGFGSARSINRRYIADTFSTEERTAASAMFVTASAMGMAAGPLFASLIHMVVVRIPNNKNNVFLQPENAPGWFMFLIWAVFTFCLIAYFQDPPRTWDSVLENIPISNGNGEDSPLLVKKSRSSNDLKRESKSQAALHQNAPVLLTLFVCFVLKLQVEAVLSSAATLPKLYFEWEPSVVGIYLAGLGFMVLPANYVIGYLAGSWEDRDLIVGLLIMMVLGGALMLDGSWAYTELQYIVASTLLFVGSTALEGPNLSLLSKSIPVSWRKGVFNVGLLATESGTFGRTVADALLTIFGAHGADHLLNRTFGSFTLISFCTLFLCCQNFKQLKSVDRDD